MTERVSGARKSCGFSSKDDNSWRSPTSRFIFISIQRGTGTYYADLLVDASECFECLPPECFMKLFLSRFPLSWVCYLAYFVGVSFQSGGIVHYSLDPSRYGKLIVIGAVIFVIGAIPSDLIGKESLLRNSGPVGFIVFILSSLLLSIGVGVIGGSVQHFNDIPGAHRSSLGLGSCCRHLGITADFAPTTPKRNLLARWCS